MQEDSGHPLLMHIVGSGEDSVQLLDFMGTDQEIAALFHNAPDAPQVEDIQEIIQHLLKRRISVPFEMAAHMRFRIRAPHLVYDFFLRQRAATLLIQDSFQSKLALYVPAADEWQRANGEGDFHPEMGQVLTDKFEKLIGVATDLYLWALKSGASHESAAKYLPTLMTYTTFQVRADLYTLFSILEQVLTTNSGASHELTKFASLIFEEFVRPAFPLSAAAFADLRLRR